MNFRFRGFKNQSKTSCYGIYTKTKTNFNEVFSSIVKHNSIRILLSMVALIDLELDQIDVKINFSTWEYRRRDFSLWGLK